MKTSTRAGLGVLAALGAILLARYAPKLLLSVVAVGMAYAGARGFLSVPLRHRWVSKWSLVRRLRKLRKALNPQPAAFAMYSACFGCTWAAVLLFMAIESVPVLYGSVVMVGVLLCFGTLLDWYGRLQHVMSSAVARKLATTAAGFLAAVVAFASLVVAKQVVHGIAHVDPAAMPEFVRLCASLVFPCMYAGAVAVLLSGLMLAQYVFLAMMLIAGSVVRWATVAVSSERRKESTDFLYRLVHGRKPPNARVWWHSCVDGIHHLLRPIGTGLVVVLVLGAGQGLVGLFAVIPQHVLQQALVMVEYRVPHLCDSVPHTVPVAYLPGGYVSVAKASGQAYEFALAKCR